MPLFYSFIKSHTLNNRGNALTKPNAHGGKSDLGVLLLHDVK